MSKSYEMQGVIHSMGATTAYGNNGFTKREFVIKVTGPDENPSWPNYAAFELVKDKCALLDQYQVGQEVQIQFNINGRLWAGNGQGERCFTSLQAWRVAPAQAAQANQGFDEHFNQAPPQAQFDQRPQQAAPAQPQPVAAQPQHAGMQTANQAPMGQTFSSDNSAWDDDIPF
ncbi:DUF3127 domain-containing protein [Paraferrimonas sp. SM1919]|uniref:DUF3127 domain-containing protein n=1 Tax=Paraferrimonas sp. SM1919 TaxID=2662263 RepID=UPI0013CFA584|nr:DUF3127 domain-containing protein [Paraferrimonas sp. SM1919]